MCTYVGLVLPVVCAGADLGAVLAEAQLGAVHETLEQHGERTLPIRWAHIDTALRTVRPSLPKTERARLEALYSRFQSDKTRMVQPGTRVTAA